VSVANAVKVYVPAAVHVPESAPAEVNVMPVGNVPALLLHVYEPFAPVAVNVCVYAVPTVPDVNTVGFAPFGDTVTEHAGCTVYDCVPKQPLESVALIVKVCEVFDVGVPVTVVVLPGPAPNDSPACSVPQ
jgi:hypothetical protein